MSIQNNGMSNSLYEIPNGQQSGISAPTTPNVVRKYYEMKYGDKSSTSNPPISMSSNATSFDGIQSNINSLPIRNGILSGKGPPSSTSSKNFFISYLLNPLILNKNYHTFQSKNSINSTFIQKIKILNKKSQNIIFNKKPNFQNKKLILKTSKTLLALGKIFIF